MGQIQREAWLVTHDGKLSLLLFPLRYWCENVTKVQKTDCHSGKELTHNSFNGFVESFAENLSFNHGNILISLFLKSDGRNEEKWPFLGGRLRGY